MRPYDPDEEDEIITPAEVAASIVSALPCLFLTLLIVSPCIILAVGSETKESLAGSVVSKSWEKSFDLQKNSGRKDKYKRIIWEALESFTKTGTENTPVWPEAPVLSANQRLSNKREYYSLIVKSADGAIRTRRVRKPVWDQFAIGDNVIIDINGFDDVKRVRHDLQKK